MIDSKENYKFDLRVKGLNNLKNHLMAKRTKYELFTSVNKGRTSKSELLVTNKPSVGFSWYLSPSNLNRPPHRGVHSSVLVFSMNKNLFSVIMEA